MIISKLEQKKEKILKRIQGLGDMRNGTVSIRYQKCGKSPCICHSPGHPGHGPIFSFSTIVNGKTKIKNYKVGPELSKIQEEIGNYNLFKELSKELISISSKICALRPVPEVKDNNELEDIKKKLQKIYKVKYKRK